MVVYGCIWLYMVVYGCIWLYMVVSSCCVHIPKREFQNGERGGLTNWLSSQRDRFDRYLIDV